MNSTFGIEMNGPYRAAERHSSNSQAFELGCKNGPFRAGEQTIPNLKSAAEVVRNGAWSRFI